ncbi:thioredoxin reductase 1, cytoplasmic-like [Chlorocebus sabaeus]|uniref:thioredoxin reductase 1, cytoplasmic-like n=1 Tax=Chlorocebus sabaeus TaxID=60711 RepID=UPI0018B08096|nr:thioredoxin reductase 1, cytoplasmic-like [Chlorocebus sabaeus]
MGCTEGKAVAVAAPPELHTKGKNGGGRRTSAKDHHPGKTLPENPAGFTSTATADLRALLQAYIDGHSVVIFSRSTCTRCAEVKKLFKSLCVPYFVLELDQTGKFLFNM